MLTGPLLKLLISSGIYSLTPLLEKTIMKTLQKDVYISIKYALRFAVVVVMSIVSSNGLSKLFSSDKFSNAKHFNQIKITAPYLIMAAIVAFSSQYLYLDVLSSMDVSYVEPIGNVLINLFTVLIGVMLLGESLTQKKILGLAFGMVSIFLLT